MPKFEPAVEKTTELAPEGTHMAYLYSIVDYGTQENKGSYWPKREVWFTFELMEEYRDFQGTQKPLIVTHKLNLPTVLKDKSHLYGLLRDLNGGKALSPEQLAYFNPKEWVGRAVSVTVVHEKTKKGKDFAKVTNVASLPQKLKLDIPQFNPNVTFDLDVFSKDEFDTLHDWQKKIIAVSPEYLKLFDEGVTEGE